MKRLPRGGWVVVLFASALGCVGCTEERSVELPPSSFADVNSILEEHCVECHGGPLAAADYRVEDYLLTIRCIPDPDGQPATLPSDPSAPILAALERPDHVGLLDAEETEALTDWVEGGAVPASRGTHPSTWTDPRAEEWHGSYLRETNWRAIVDPESEDACGLCHAGSPAPVEEVSVYPPGATDCTECHSLPGGVMACGTCHGDGLRPYPPRDQCYFRGPPAGYAHDPHVESSPTNWSGLGCEACHFGEDFSMLGGKHANGMVDVVFQPAWGADATYDSGTKQCSTTCHIRGGTTPDVAWDEEGLDLQCNACHQNPPIGHATIACNGCHVGINAAGTQLTPAAPHINGRVDAFR
jgi:predicted CxxxxCH...CXXCH cytochrome family protein